MAKDVQPTRQLKVDTTHRFRMGERVQWEMGTKDTKRWVWGRVIAVIPADSLPSDSDFSRTEGMYGQKQIFGRRSVWSCESYLVSAMGAVIYPYREEFWGASLLFWPAPTVLVPYDKEKWKNEPFRHKSAAGSDSGDKPTRAKRTRIATRDKRARLRESFLAGDASVPEIQTDEAASASASRKRGLDGNGSGHAGEDRRRRRG